MYYIRTFVLRYVITKLKYPETDEYRNTITMFENKTKHHDYIEIGCCTGWFKTKFPLLYVENEVQ